MRYFIIAVALAAGFGLAASTYAADDRGGQEGMQPGTSKGSLGNPGSKDLGSTSQDDTSSPSKKSGESGPGMEKDQQGMQKDQQGMQKEQQSMQKEQQKSSPSTPGTTSTTEGRGDRY